MKFNTAQNVCCRVLHCVCDEKSIYNYQYHYGYILTEKRNGVLQKY